MFGKGIPMVTTALALSSVKSSPSLTFPLQTAMSRAPSATKKQCYTYMYDDKKNKNNSSKLPQLHCNAPIKYHTYKISWKKLSPVKFSLLTSFITAFDGIVIGLKQLVKIPLGAAARLGDHSLLLF